jgi:hypothetical protein
MSTRVTVLCLLLALAASFAGFALENTFSEEGFGYTIEYPGDWIVERPSDYTVRFTGVAWTTASRVAFAIQNVASSAIGGIYDTVEELLDELKCQLVTGADDICIYIGEPITAVDTSGVTLVGPQLLVEYEYEGDVYKEWLAIVPHASGDVFFLATFDGLRDDYDRYEPTVLDMLSTWAISGTAGESGTGTPTPTTGSGDIQVLLEDSGHLGPYDYAAGSFDKRYYDVVVTTHGYLAIAVIDEAGESISGWIYTPSGVELMHKPGNYAEIYTDAYEVFPGSYELKVGQDTMVTESDFAVYVFFSTSLFTVEDLIAEFGSEYQVMP